MASASENLVAKSRATSAGGSASHGIARGVAVIEYHASDEFEPPAQYSRNEIGRENVEVMLN